MSFKDIIYVHGGTQIANQVEKTTETHTGYWLRRSEEIVCCFNYQSYIYRMRTHEKCTCGRIYPKFSSCAECADRTRLERINAMSVVHLQEGMSVYCNDRIFSNINDLFENMFFSYHSAELNLRCCPETELEYEVEIQHFFENEMPTIFTVKRKHPEINIEDVVESFYQNFNFEHDIGEPNITNEIYESVAILNKHLQDCYVEVQGDERIDNIDLSQMFIKWLPFDIFLEHLQKESMHINFEKKKD
jgi:hypothetical protein